jgi:hypothetical protein
MADEITCTFIVSDSCDLLRWISIVKLVRSFLRVEISIPFADENIFDHIISDKNFGRAEVVVDG